MPGHARHIDIREHRRLQGLGYPIPTILITAYPDDGDRASALTDDIVCYLSKPVADNDLLACVRSALRWADPSGGGP